MLWECDGCGQIRVSDPVAGDDYHGGELVGIGPTCQECDVPMFCVADDGDECPVCGGVGENCPYCVGGKVWRRGSQE